MNSNERSWFRRQALLVAALPLFAVGGFASTGATGEPVVRLMTVSYGDATGKCEKTHNDEPKKAKQSDNDTVLLRLDNRCRANVEVTITAKAGVFSCEAQPSTAVLHEKFLLAARSKAYLDCTLDYSGAIGGDFEIVFKPKKPARGSELALEAVP